MTLNNIKSIGHQFIFGLSVAAINTRLIVVSILFVRRERRVHIWHTALIAKQVWHFCRIEIPSLLQFDALYDYDPIAINCCCVHFSFLIVELGQQAAGTLTGTGTLSIAMLKIVMINCHFTRGAESVPAAAQYIRPHSTFLGWLDGTLDGRATRQIMMTSIN